MLETVTSDSVVFCELVEHPGGHDGGEFPQRHKYGVETDGVYYSTDFPDCPNDAFCDEPEEDYLWSSGLAGARDVLTTELQKAKAAVATLESLVVAFERAKDLKVYFGDGED